MFKVNSRGFYTAYFDHSCLEAIITASLINVRDRQLAPCGGRCCLYSAEVKGQKLKGSSKSQCCFFRLASEEMFIIYKNAQLVFVSNSSEVVLRVLAPRKFA